MRSQLLIAFLLTCTTFLSFAQKVKITDDATRKPVSEVFIFHENKTDVAYSNENGEADLSGFPTGKIFFQHPSYLQESASFSGSDLTISLTERIISYDEVVVSANKWEQQEEDVSQKIISVNRKAIQFQNPQTSADLLANSGQVFVQKSQLGGGSPKIRGFSANSVLLVVDGVRMNNAIFRSGNLQNVINIDANALESSEVIFGPGSVIYGSDALGGVMDFHTINPSWSSDDQMDIKANALGRYSTAANERTGHLDVSVSKRKFTFFHSSSFTLFDDLRSGANRSGGYEGEFERTFYVGRTNGQDQLIRNSDVNIQKFSGYDLFNTISKAKFRLGTYADISYGFYFSTTSDIPRYDNLTETLRPDTDSLANAEWYYGPQKWQMHNLQFNYYQSNALFDQSKVTVAFQKFEESRNDRAFGDDRLRTRTELVDMISVSLDFDKEYRRSNLYYGLDFYHNDVASGGFRKNIETGALATTSSRYPDGGSTFTSLAAYSSLVHRFSEQVVMNAGVRYNSILLKAKTTDSTALSNSAGQIDLKNAAINGALGLAYKMDEFNRFSLNVSTGFRAPNVDDVGKVFDVGNSIIVPNPNLDPEYSLSYEASYERKSENTVVKLVGFYSRLFNAILDGPFSLNGNSTLTIDGEELDVFAKVNAGRAEIYGGSLLLRTQLGRNWALSKTITYTDGKDLSNNEPLRHTTPIFGRAEITHKWKGLRSQLSVDYNLSRGREEIPFSEIERKPYLYTDSGTPGWYTLNLRTSYQVSDILNVNVGFENLLDKHYRPYSSGISAPGRNFIIAVRASL